MYDVSYIEKVRVRDDLRVVCFVRCHFCNNMHHHDYGRLNYNKQYTDIRGAKCLPFFYKIVIHPERYPYFIIDNNDKIERAEIERHVNTLVEKN